MAIKVKHEGSVASRMAASAEGGRAKRAMEAAALVKPTQIQTLQPAHASAPGVSTPHAQLISAPGHAQLVTAAPVHGGRGGGGGGGRSPSAPATSSDGDYKITGRDRSLRPDDESEWVWDNGGIGSTGKWIRKWLPGEKEAEALDRVGTVRNMQRKDIEGFLHGLLKDRAEQSSLLTTERNVMIARLKAMLGAPTVPGTAVKSPFSDAPADTGAGDTGTGDALDKQQTAVMSELDDIAADARAKSGLPQQPEQSDDLKMLVDSIAGQGGEVVADAGGDTPDDIAGVYANGGSIFGGQDGGDGGNALAWLRPDESAGAPSVGDDSAAADEFASSIGGLINALMRKGSNYV